MAVTTSDEDAMADRAGALRSAAAAETLLLDVVRRHADELLRIARLHSLCADDAHDAYQRGLEQFLRHGRRLRAETAERWLFTVVKREALAVRRARGELLGPNELDDSRVEARHDASPEDRALASDAVARSAQALQVLKPQEVRALWLRADGRSYAEIQAVTGWSYTKVNRCLTEGRRRFLARCAALESGAACERWTGVLAALADGRADAGDLAALRPHLRRCPACRATLRALHDSSASMAIVLPPGVVGTALEAHGGAEPLDAVGRWLTRLYEGVAGPLQERAATGALKWQAAVEAAANGKAAAVAASSIALAGGGSIVTPPAGAPVFGSGAHGAPRRSAAVSTIASTPDARDAVPGSPPDARPRGVRSARPAVGSAAPGSPGVREFLRGAGVEPPALGEFGRGSVGAGGATGRATRAEFEAGGAAYAVRGEPARQAPSRAARAEFEARAPASAARAEPARDGPPRTAPAEFGP